MATMWDRYIPNFWGPVYARRLARSDKWILLFWSMLFGASLLAIGVGFRRELRRMEELVVISPREWSRWNVSSRLAVSPAWPAEPRSRPRGEGRDEYLRCWRFVSD